MVFLSYRDHALFIQLKIVIKPEKRAALRHQISSIPDLERDQFWVLGLTGEKVKQLGEGGG